MSKCLFIYGILMPLTWVDDCKFNHYNEQIVELNTISEICSNDIVCIKSPNNNEVIVGRVFKLTSNDFKVPYIDNIEKHEILDLVYKKYKLKGEFNLHFILYDE